MLRYRLIYAITLASAIGFFIVYSPWFSWYFLVLVLLLIPLDLLISLPGLFTKSVRLSAPLFLEKDTHGILAVTAIHKKPFPVRSLLVRLRVIGDDFVARCSVVTPAGSVNRGEIVVDTSRTGLTVFEIKKLYTVSLLGLISKSVNVSGKVSVLVLPRAQKPADTVDLPKNMILVPKQGGGFSEEHDMRPYLAGDPVRSIHHKLSAKFDSLIVREPLVPPQQSRLVHIIPWENAEQRDSALSHLRWISNYLIDKGLVFYVRFGERGLLREVVREADLIDYLRLVLDNTNVLKPMHSPRLTRFAWVYKIDASEGYGHKDA